MNIVWPPPNNFSIFPYLPISFCKVAVIGAWYAPPIGALPFALPEMNNQLIDPPHRGIEALRWAELEDGSTWIMEPPKRNAQNGWVLPPKTKKERILVPWKGTISKGNEFFQPSIFRGYSFVSGRVDVNVLDMFLVGGFNPSEKY